MGEAEGPGNVTGARERTHNNFQFYWGMGYPELRQALRNIPSSLNDRDFLPSWGSRLILGSPTAVLLSLKTPALGYLLQQYRLNSKPTPAGRNS